MNQQITWQDCVIVIDELIETLKAKIYTDPARGEFWQQRLAVNLLKKQEILMLATQHEEQQFNQQLSTIFDNVLRKSK